VTSSLHARCVGTPLRICLIHRAPGRGAALVGLSTARPSSAALLRAIYALRLIKIVTGSGRPTVLAAGCGHPGTPWWKWFMLTPEGVKLSAGILTANHVLCEMHQRIMADLALIGRRMLQIASATEK
jgi:hypothetical protein